MSTDVAESVHCPFLVVAGEEDDLGPIDHTWSLLQRFRGPRELVLYQGERHGIAGGAASSLGPHRDELVGEWFVDRLGGRRMDDRLRHVTTTGTVFGEEIDFSRPVAATVAGRGPR